jgi:3-hydroxyacyl-CoA dehydrogenase/enoyl-CoA hydratase/3-hydroxybutyryl-CoA epimerase
MTAATQYWHLDIDKDNVAWLTLDYPNSPVNKLSRAVLAELDSMLTEVAQKQPRGVIFASAKSSGFIAGADIEDFTTIKTPEEAEEYVKNGQRILNRITELKMPTVAMINGFCLGGGLELALACRFRVALDSSKTRLGLPEVMLGIYPGWGGASRLPALVGGPQGLDLLLTGRAVLARVAKKLGFVDCVTEERHLKQAAKFYASTPPKAKQGNWYVNLTNNALVRPLIAKMVRSKLEQKVKKEHYPSPYAIVDNWEKNYGVAPENFAKEAKSISQLISHPTAENLIRCFFLQEKLKSAGKGVEYNPLHVHVVGAGVMGGDIAAWCALRGFTVTLQDREPQFIAPAIKRAGELYKRKLKLPREIKAAKDRLIPDPQGLGIKKADLIIEAIIENLDAKQALFKEIEEKAKPDAILATNTSSIPLDEINKALKMPRRLVGIHFFNPVAEMRLVEVVEGKKSDPEILKKATAFVKKIDKLPLAVKSSPGFLVNRVLTPYLMEAMALKNDGVSPALIDKVAKDFGMPMGPIELADVVGLDVCLSVAEHLSHYLPVTIPDELREKVKNKELGRKTGQGFYTYKNGKAIKPVIKASSISNEQICHRLVMRMVNESFACLREGVVENGDLVDAGMIFGTGFAPFRGGPVHYAKSLGVAEVAQIFETLQKVNGERFILTEDWRHYCS